VVCMIVKDKHVSASEFGSRTGWELKPQGLCKGDMCVPAPNVANSQGLIDVMAAAERLNMAVVTDPATAISAIGPEAMGHSLTTAVAPELELADVDGIPFKLSSLHGRKVLLMAWASW